MKQNIKQDIENQIVELLAPLPDLFLVNTKIDAKNNISVFLDGDNGIAIGQCASLNRQLYKFIEENNLFPNNDFALEVSSAGVDAPLILLRQYQKNLNRKVEVILKDGSKLEGKLLAATAEEISIETITGKGKKAVTTIEQVPLGDIKSTVVQVQF